MKFKSYGPRFAFQDTPRKRAAAVRKLARERDALPLFAAQISAEQPGIDAIMAERAARWARQEQAMREAVSRYGGPADPVGWSYPIRQEQARAP